uniref:aldo/keto reductase n=1 Tax=Brucella intermedia TaxID=94625 RepID=UPI0023603826
AKEMGLGITPWSPLKFGVLSGKFTRDKHGKHEPGRGDWVREHLTEKAYDIIDEIIKISKELKTSPARVALSWLQN